MLQLHMQGVRCLIASKYLRAAMRLTAFVSVVVLFATGCCPESEVPIPENLREMLGQDCRVYTGAINGAVHGDTAALHDFLRIDHIIDVSLSDGLSYDHGDVLVGVLQRIGDESFALGLKRLTQEQRQSVASHFAAGFDMDPKAHLVIVNHPLTFSQLKSDVRLEDYMPVVAEISEPTIDILRLGMTIADSSIEIRYDVRNRGGVPQSINIFLWYVEPDSAEHPNDDNFDENAPCNIIKAHTGDRDLGPTWSNEPNWLLPPQGVRIGFLTIAPGKKKTVRVLYKASEHQLRFLKRATSLMLQLPVYMSEVAARSSIGVDDLDTITVHTDGSIKRYEQSYFLMEKHAASTRPSLSDEQSWRTMEVLFCGRIEKEARVHR